VPVLSEQITLQQPGEEREVSQFNTENKDILIIMKSVQEKMQMRPSIKKIKKYCARHLHNDIFTH